MEKELIAKAKEAKTPEELMALAKEKGVEMTAEKAQVYFDQLHPKTGELSDEELDNVAGGGCYAND
ncbi:unknown [Clostridium sp. CAG:448]|nr:unknown [Clostridium sp. CAG:448]